MKRILNVLFVLVVLASCQNSTKNEKANQNEEAVELSVDEILQNGENFIGKTVVLDGIVTHVCKQTGGRCYLMGSTESNSIRVEAGKQIGSFTQELMGSDLKVEGILNEFIVTEDYLNEKEALALEGKESNEDHIFGHGGSGKHDEESGLIDNERLDQIAAMRTQLLESEKPYITIYYVEGSSYIELP